MSLSNGTVTLVFELLLGRKPENQAVMDHYAQHPDILALGKIIMDSPEFKKKCLQSAFPISKWVSTEVLDRYSMLIDLHDLYVSYGCLNNDWEPEETRFFKSRLSAGDTVLDIGANIGWFTLVAAKEIGLHGKVHAFEPRPETVRRLKQTIALNRLRETVQVWEFALSDQTDTMQLKWERNTVNPGHSYLCGSAEENFDPVISAKVLACKLDDLLPDIAPDIIKIDVEGAEPKALMGARNALKRKHPIILSELYPAQLASVSGITSAAFICQMEEINYCCYELKSGQPTRRIKDFPSDRMEDLISVVFEKRGAL